MLIGFDRVINPPQLSDHLRFHHCSVFLEILQWWGTQAGQVDVFMDRLPGFPDGVCSAPGGSFWVSIVSPPQAPMQCVTPSRRPTFCLLHHFLCRPRTQSDYNSHSACPRET